MERVETTLFITLLSVAGLLLVLGAPLPAALLFTITLGLSSGTLAAAIASAWSAQKVSRQQKDPEAATALPVVSTTPALPIATVVPTSPGHELLSDAVRQRLGEPTLGAESDTNTLSLTLVDISKGKLDMPDEFLVGGTSDLFVELSKLPYVSRAAVLKAGLSFLVDRNLPEVQQVVQHVLQDPKTTAADIFTSETLNVLASKGSYEPRWPLDAALESASDQVRDLARVLDAVPSTWSYGEGILKRFMSMADEQREQFFVLLQGVVENDEAITQDVLFRILAASRV